KMPFSWDQLQKVAEDNTRTTAQKLEEERLKKEREKRIKQQKLATDKSVSEKLVQMINEKRHLEQQKEEQQRRQQIHDLKKRQSAKLSSSSSDLKKKTLPSVSNTTEKQSNRTVQNKQCNQTKQIITSNTSTTVTKTSQKRSSSMPNIPYELIMKLADLRANKQPIPKELSYVTKICKPNNDQKPAKNESVHSNQVSRPKSSTTAIGRTNGYKMPVSTSLKEHKTKTTSLKEHQTKTTSVSVSQLNTPLRSDNKQTTQNKQTAQKTSLTNTSTKNDRLITSKTNINTNGNFKRPVSTNNSSLNIHMDNGRSKSTTPTKMSTLNQTKTTTAVNKTPQLQQRSQIHPQKQQQQFLVKNNGINGRKEPAVSRKRPMYADSDDEEDDEMRDFIVDDDEDAEYQRELDATLKSVFKFDKKKYANMRLDDDDDIRMESSWNEMEKEEEYSRYVGLKEDIEDIMKEEAEKKLMKQKRMKMSKR
ncbi:unnamed protein product, partial [Didymodactylos carnosus]